jgi:3-mercaptopyruvate sulfurtransferase SseA
MAATDLAGLLALLPRQQVVVYCRQGYRGALAQKELHPVHPSRHTVPCCFRRASNSCLGSFTWIVCRAQLGVSRIVYNLQGGWEGWNAAA